MPASKPQTADSTVPSHLGLILDGNRRWAKQHNLPSLEGHRQGYDNLKTITKMAFDKGVNTVSAYIFSVENWRRTPVEVKYLMNLAYRMLTKDVEELNKENIRVVWLGTAEGLSKKLVEAIAKAEALTASNTRGTLALCFNYGGYEEIVDAAKQVIKKGLELTDQAISKALYGGTDVPQLDLIVRTSGEQRLSGFMLWRSAYAELYFTDTYWPDFDEAELDKALTDYASRERRFGSS
jgi:undecaprenyl diphosphate synthase